MATPFAYSVVSNSAGHPVSIQPAAGSNLLAAWATVQACITNQGSVYVGTHVALTQGYILPSPVSFAGYAPEITFGSAPVHLSEIFMTPAVNGEGVRIIGEGYDF